jgi:hypothetical protein
MPAESFPKDFKPLQSIRLPPINIQEVKEKVPNNTATNTISSSVIYTKPNNNLILKVSEVLESKRNANVSECRKDLTSNGLAAERPPEPEYVLPGQVSENSFGKITRAVNVRNIELDYSAASEQEKDIKENDCGFVRFFKRFCCCSVKTDDNQDHVEDRMDAVAEIRRSIPRKIWSRVKTYFRF